MSKKAQGRVYSEDSRKKMSFSKKGKPLTKNQINSNFAKGRPCVPIIQYDLEGNFLNIWDSFKTIKEEFGFFESGLVNCCKGKQKTAYGYKWKYKNKQNAINNKKREF